MPPSRNAGFSVASFSSVVSARGPSSWLDDAPPAPFFCGISTGDQLVGEAARLLRRDRLSVRVEGELVLLLARDAPLLRDVLRGLAHLLEREQRLHASGSDSASRATCRRAPTCRWGSRRAAWAWTTARGSSTPRRRRSRCRPRRGGSCRAPWITASSPLPHSRFTVAAGHRLRIAREQQRHARHVAVVLAGLVRAAHVDLVHAGRVETVALQRALQTRPRRDRLGARP